MTSRDVALKIAMTADIADATSGFDAVGSAADGMTRHVDDAGTTAEQASRKLRLSADAADDFGGKAGRATGALGALASGFELVGLDGFATGLQSASMATDFFSGVGDSLNLVLESTALKSVKAKGALVAQSVATKAAGVATTVMTGATAAFNAVMAVNPVVLVVIALAALVAGLVLAYKHSEKVRDIVDTVGRVGKAALGKIVEVAGDVVDWIGDKIPGGFDTLRTVAVRVFTIITTPWRLQIKLATTLASWLKEKVPAGLRHLREIGRAVLDKVAGWIGKVIDKARDLKDWIADKITGGLSALRDKASGVLDRVRGLFDSARDAARKVKDLVGDIPGKLGELKDKAEKIGGAIIAPFKSVKGFIEDIISLIGKIHIPDLPGWIPGVGGRVAAPAVAGPGTWAAPTVYAAPTARQTVNINVQGAVDAYSTARQIRQILGREAIGLARA